MDGSWESVFLLPGDDHSVHLYRESRLAENDGKARDQVSVRVLVCVYENEVCDCQYIATMPELLLKTGSNFCDFSAA